jgi:MATE family multidrug resistance protein
MENTKLSRKLTFSEALCRYFRDCWEIIKLGLPVLVSQIGMIVVGFADNIMVGHYSTDALASASFVNNLFNLPIFCAMGFSYGLTPIIGALFTQGNHDRIGKTVRAGVAINLLVSLLLIVVMGIVYILLPKLGQPEELLPIIRPYFLIYMIGMVPICLFNVFAQWSYGIRNTAMPMWIMLAANVINVAGNYILIFGHFGAPELGLTGAGLATFTSRIFSALVIAYYFFHSKAYRSYSAGYHNGHPGSDVYRLVVKMSWPIALQMSFETACFSGCAIMCGWLGAIEMAAYQIIIIVGTLGFCIYYAMATGVSVLVANEAGLNNPAGMQRHAFAGYGVIMACCLMSSLFFSLGSEHVMKIFTDDPAVLAAAVGVIFPLVLYQVGDATQINFASCLRGSGNVKPMMWIAFVSYMIIGIPSSYLLAFTLKLGLFGIVLSFSCSLFIAAALFLYFFLTTLRSTAPQPRPKE